MTLEDRLVALAQRVAAVVGAPQDWATIFTGALDAPTSVPAASTTQSGLALLASSAEAAAGTNALKAITPATLAAWDAAKLCTSFADLNAKAQVSRPGTWLALSDYTTPQGNTIALALFSVRNGYAYAISPIYGSDGTGQNLRTEVAAVFNSTTTYKYVVPTAECLVSGGALYYHWSIATNSFVPHTETLLGDYVLNSGIAVSAWDATFPVEQRIVEGGKRAELTIGFKKGATVPWATGDILMTLASAKPLRQYNYTFSGYGSTNGWVTGLVSLNIAPSGAVSLNAVAPNVLGLFGTFQWPLT